MYGRSWVKDLAGAVGAVAVPYLGASMAKATGKPLTSALVTVGAGVVGTLAKKSVRDQNWQEFATGAGYGGLGYFGTWLAANTTTLGGKPAGNIPLQDLAASKGAAAAIAAARARAAALRAGAASFPPSSTAQVQPLSGYRATRDLTEAV